MTIIAFHDHAVKAEMTAGSIPRTLSLAGETRMYSVSFPGIGRCEHCGAPGRGRRVGSASHTPTLICHGCIEALARAWDPALGACWTCGAFGPGRLLAHHVVCELCRDGLLGWPPARESVPDRAAQLEAARVAVLGARDAVEERDRTRAYLALVNADGPSDGEEVSHARTYLRD